MNAWVRIGLLAVALVAYAGGGAALAALRSRSFDEGRSDVGLLSIAAALLAIGALCTMAATSLVGILAFGGVSVWASYAAAAQRLGLFRVQTSLPEEAPVEETGPRA